MAETTCVQSHINSFLPRVFILYQNVHIEHLFNSLYHQQLLCLQQTLLGIISARVSYFFALCMTMCSSLMIHIYCHVTLISTLKFCKLAT